MDMHSISVAPMMEQGRRSEKELVNSIRYELRFFHVAPCRTGMNTSNLRNYRR